MLVSISVYSGLSRFANPFIHRMPLKVTFYKSSMHHVLLNIIKKLKYTFYLMILFIYLFVKVKSECYIQIQWTYCEHDDFHYMVHHTQILSLQEKL